jgi:hypothetical protein
MSCYRHAGAKGKRIYGSFSFLISALEEQSGQRHAPVGWTSQLFWTQMLEKKSFAYAGDRTSVFYSAVKR